MAEAKKGQGLVYKNHPLRRIDNLIYYGSMADKYIVMFQILETKKEQDMDVATRVSVQLQLAQDAAVEAYISYDGGKSWQAQGVLQGTGAMGRSCLHLRPRRCDRLRWRLQGVGDCTVYSVSAVYEKGSDSL